MRQQVQVIVFASTILCLIPLLLGAFGICRFFLGLFFGGFLGAFACNAHLDSAATREFCTLGPGAETLIQRAIDQFGFSARAYDKVLRVARTLADLDDAEKIEERHIAEAIQYRNLDRQIL